VYFNNNSFIGKYFNVEFDDIKSKLISSIIPFNKNFSKEVETQPDLYGPFWLYTTLIIVLVVTSNFARYLTVSKLQYK
jgi:hypothetical protein